MLDRDKRSVVRKLEMLNRYINDELEKSKENIEFWRQRIEEYGRNELIKNAPTNVSYGECLTLSMSNMEHNQRRIEENNRLIKLLEEELYE